MEIAYNVVQLFEEPVRTGYDECYSFTRSSIIKSFDNIDSAENFVCDMCLTIENIREVNKQINIHYHESFKTKKKDELESIEETRVKLQKQIEQLVDDFCADFFYITSQYNFDELNFEIRTIYSPSQV